MVYDVIEVDKQGQTVLKLVLRCDVCNQIMHLLAAVDHTVVYPSDPHEHWCDACLCARDQLPVHLRRDRRSVLVKRGLVA